MSPAIKDSMETVRSYFAVLNVQLSGQKIDELLFRGWRIKSAVQANGYIYLVLHEHPSRG